MAARAGVGRRLRAALERRRCVRAPAAGQARPPVRAVDAADRARDRLPARGTRVRQRLGRLPLRLRLTLAGPLLLPPALAVVIGLVFLRFEGGLNSAIDGDLRARAGTLSIMVARQGPQALLSRPAVELRRPLGAFGQVVDRRGRVL